MLERDYPWFGAPAEAPPLPGEPHRRICGEPAARSLKFLVGCQEQAERLAALIKESQGQARENAERAIRLAEQAAEQDALGEAMDRQGAELSGRVFVADERDNWLRARELRVATHTWVNIYVSLALAAALLLMVTMGNRYLPRAAEGWRAVPRAGRVGR